MSHSDITLPAYANSIGVVVDHWEGTRPVLAIEYANSLCGNPGTYHGGVIATLLEMTALATLDADLRAGRGAAQMTPVNATVEFLRPTREAPAFASGRIVRAGRRLANVQAMLWQDSEDKPVATAIINIEISPMA